MVKLDRERIDPDADKVVRKLAESGYQAYLVGGCVRDLLLNRAPKDFDVATNATPHEIRRVFRNSRIIGRRFRLVHVVFGDNIIETATFRANPRKSDKDSELLIRRDNVFGTVIEDAHRRDFTMNGLFYDVQKQQVIDHVGGIQDVKDRVVRTIGDPDIRFQEDPVRILRAIKFAARLDFQVEEQTWKACISHRLEILKSSPARVQEELFRMLRSGASKTNVSLLQKSGVGLVFSQQFSSLFPPLSQDNSTHIRGVELLCDKEEATDTKTTTTEEVTDPEEIRWHATWSDEDRTTPKPLTPSFVSKEEASQRLTQSWEALDAIDRLKQSGTILSNSGILAAIVAPVIFPELIRPGLRATAANTLILEIAAPLYEELGLTRKDSERSRQILLMLRRLESARKRGTSIGNLKNRDYFAEAIEVYALCCQLAEIDATCVDSWRVHTSSTPQNNDNRTTEATKLRKRRRGGKRRRRNYSSADAKG